MDEAAAQTPVDFAALANGEDPKPASRHAELQLPTATNWGTKSRSGKTRDPHHLPFRDVRCGEGYFAYAERLQIR
ncbi:hypothetical protein ACIP6I_04590 [Streptomyces anulatus]